MGITRRTFLHGLAAAGATVAAVGCGKGGDEYYYETGSVGGKEPEDLNDLSKAIFSYASCPHNCGTTTRCVSKLWIQNGRVTRVTTDDSEFDVNGNYKADRDQYNCSRNFSCAKGHAYKYRMYHSGRLRYPMKQTKKRGDLTGFVRITWQQALNEVMRKYRAIYAKYGLGAIYGVNRNNNITTTANAGWINNAVTTLAESPMYANLSYHQFIYASQMSGIPRHAQDGGGIVAAYPYIDGGAIKNIVSWGTNSITTSFSGGYAYSTIMRKLKANGGKHYILTPDFSDTCVMAATDWIQVRNYTDSAVAAAMVYEMIINSFNEDGSYKGASAWLDVDYIDTCVYGFFDSPEYWLQVETEGYFNGTATNRGSVVFNPNTDAIGTVYMTAAAAKADKWKLVCGDYWIKTGGAIPVGTIQLNAPANTTGWTNKSSDSYWIKDEATVNADSPVGTIVTSAPANMTGWTAGTGYWEVTGVTSSTGDGEPNGTVKVGLPADLTGYTYQRNRWQNQDNTSVYAYTEPIRKINAVPSGRSYASWVMGSDDRLTKALYNARNNYTAQKYGNMPRAGKCSMPIKGTPAHLADPSTTDYYTKKDYMKPKDAVWAEKISGAPAAQIRELARFYSNTANHPIITMTGGGLQKGENGVPTVFSLLMLNVVTKNWGNTGTNYFDGTTGYSTGDPVNRGTAPYSGNDLLPSFTNPTTPTLSGKITQAVPTVSVKDHMGGYSMAFLDEMKANGFKGYGNPQWDGTSRYLYDEACIKTFIKYKRDEKGNLVTFTDSDGQEYFDYEGRSGTNGAGTPVFSGKRFLMGTSATPFQQNIGVTWAAESLETIPLGTANPDDPDSLCFVMTDMYLSPQVRFCDYVLPLAQTLESCIGANIGGQNITTLPLATPPGEAKDGWEAGFIAWNEQSKLGSFNDYKKPDGSWNTVTVGENLGYTFINEASPRYVSAAEKTRKAIQARCDTSTSRFYGMSVEEAIGAQYAPRTASPAPAAISTLPAKLPLRTALNTYLSGSMNAPFILATPDNKFVASVNEQIKRVTWSAGNTNNSAGHRSPITFKAAEGMPGDPMKMTVYAEYCVYSWEVAYNRLHAWLPVGSRGQKNEDYEGDPFLRPIPMYYAFEDDFNEIYGVHNSKRGVTRDTLSGWKTVGPRPASADLSKIKDRLTLTVSTTHDRFRTHSTQNENPLLRELNHRTVGGGPANDWNEYLVVPKTHALGGVSNFSKMLNTAVENKNRETASWIEFWMNDEDASQFGINDGDLLRISNPVGAARVVARLSKRIVRGHGNLHQGGWYDPNPVDGVDDGGCANTFISVRPSKFDNGNAQQFAYCLVEKETNFFNK